MSFPKLHEIVFAKLSNKKSGMMGNYVKLVEYNDIEGLVLCTEITKYKSDLQSLVKHTDIFPLVVVEVNKNNIDLSYSKIKKNNIELLKECYNYQNKIRSIIKTICDDLSLDLYDEMISHHITPENYDDSINQDKNIIKILYDSFLKEPSKLVEKISDEEIKNKIIEYITNKVIIKPYVTERDFKLTILEDNSLMILKQILGKIQIYCEKNNYTLSCKSSPIYQLKIQGIDLDIIKKQYDEINNYIKTKIEIYNVTYEFLNNIVVIKEVEFVF